MDSSFSLILKTSILTYTSTEKIFNVLQTMQYEAERIIEDPERSLALIRLFSGFYRRLSFADVSMTTDTQARSERLPRLVNQQSGDIFLLPNESEIPYEHLLDGLYSTGFRKSLLYLFQGNVRNESFRKWKCPKSSYRFFGRKRWKQEFHN